MNRVAETELVRYSLGCVSFLNSKPLIEPLLERAGVEVHFAVPSALLGWLEAGGMGGAEWGGRAALLPVVDYQVCAQDLVFLPAGCIACAGPTLTVRIFSPVVPGEIRTLYCDTDSHTSVILAQVILRRRYGVKAEIRPLAEHDVAGSEKGALLLIGDKVVNAAPERGFPYQLDLGEEWWELTGLPFVFACWMAPAALAPAQLRGLYHILAEGQRAGAGMTERLLDKYAAEKQWPRELARRYFTEYLRYAWTEPMTAGLRKFYELAGAEGLLKVRREIRMCRGE